RSRFARTAPSGPTAICDRVTPRTVALVPPLTVARRAAGGSSASWTSAIFTAALGSVPSCSEMDGATMDGGWLTSNVKVSVEVKPQLSVAVTVTVCVPGGFARLIATSPVAELTLTVPPKPGAEAVRTTVPLSAGAALAGTTVVAPGLIGPNVAG